MTERLFGEFGHKMIADIPKILMIYWIMIITFNLVPYRATDFAFYKLIFIERDTTSILLLRSSNI